MTCKSPHLHLSQSLDQLEVGRHKSDIHISFEQSDIHSENLEARPCSTFNFNVSFSRLPLRCCKLLKSQLKLNKWCSQVHAVIFIYCIDLQVTDFPTAKCFLWNSQELHSELVNAGSQQCEPDSSTLLHTQDAPQQLYNWADFTRVGQHVLQATATHPACDWCTESRLQQNITHTSNFLPPPIPRQSSFIEDSLWQPMLENSFIYCTPM